MRLFIAINAPQELHSYYRGLQRQFPDLKPTRDFHLTLQFLGDGIEDISEIIGNLSKIKFKPFKIKMGDIMPFPDDVSPRGIWIECESNSLKNLAQKVQKIMASLGLMPDMPFKAHITLGRYKKPPSKSPSKTKGKPQEFRVSQFCLVQSHLDSERPKYKTLATFPK